MTIKPYTYQQKSIDHLAEVLSRGDVAIDASDTGIGKTIQGLGVARNYPTLVICPKSVIHPWKETAEIMGVNLIDVLNIEKLKTGKTPYLSKLSKTNFRWNLEPGSLVIFDEAHRFGAANSQNSKILAYLRDSGIKAMLLSATLAESPLKMRALGFLLGWFAWAEYWQWSFRNGVRKSPWHNGFEFTKGKRGVEIMERLHSRVFPDYGCRVRIAELPDFPESTVISEAFDIDEKYRRKINEAYSNLSTIVSQHKNDMAERGDDEGSAMVKLLRQRQIAEINKVPLFVDLIKEHIEDGKSIAVFLNFRETLSQIQAALKVPCSLIYGQQKDRDEEIRKFQDDETRVCLAMIQAGGVGINLDDRRGVYPRVSLISPPWSAVEFKQALGRIHRATSKSKALQYIIFIAGTLEEDVCRTLKRKLKNLDALNDADLTITE